MTRRPKLIAITGGIGCGKSVVSQLLRVMGYEVYDCDSRAKWVMTHDDLLRQQLIALFGEATYLPDGSLNKPHLSAAIFGDNEALAKMNACVHPAVDRDLRKQYEAYKEITNYNLQITDYRPFFFESAILFESGFDELSLPDEVWTISAPLELRISRAMQRDHATREQVLNRINSQMTQEEKEIRANHVIWNDPEHSVIEQVKGIILPQHCISSSTPDNTEAPPASAAHSHQ